MPLNPCINKLFHINQIFLILLSYKTHYGSHILEHTDKIVINIVIINYNIQILISLINKTILAFIFIYIGFSLCLPVTSIINYCKIAA